MANDNLIEPFFGHINGKESGMVLHINSMILTSDVVVAVAVDVDLVAVDGQKKFRANFSLQTHLDRNGLAKRLWYYSLYSHLYVAGCIPHKLWHAPLSFSFPPKFLFTLA